MDTLPYELIYHIATKCDKSSQCALQVVSNEIHCITKDLAETHNFVHHTKLALNDWTNCKNPPKKKKRKYYKVLDLALQYRDAWVGTYPTFESVFETKMLDLIKCDLIPDSKKQKYIKQCKSLNIPINDQLFT